MNQNNFLSAAEKAIQALKNHDLISITGLTPYIFISFTGTNGEILTLGTAISSHNPNLPTAHQEVSKKILKQLQYAGTKINYVSSFSGDGNNYAAPNEAGFVSIAVGGIDKKQATICVGVLADILEQNKVIEF